MRNFPRLILTGMAALLALGLVTFLAPTAPVSAQSPTASASFLSFVDPVNDNTVAVSAYTPILIKYIGTSTTGATVTVAAGGDVTFAVGAVGASVADTTLECPVSGALGGILDLSTPAAACDTIGEIVDIINGSPDWRAVILDGLASDPTDNTLITLAETQANVSLGLLGDTAVTFDVARALTTPAQRSIEYYLRGSGRQIEPNAFEGTRSVLLKAIQSSTYGSGTSTFEVFSVKDSYAPIAAEAGTFKLTEVKTQLWSQAEGATTVATSFDFDNNPFGLYGYRGERILIKINNSAAMTAASSFAYGYQFPLSQR